MDGLGATWESALNSYKPFACGIVIHPTIDGCIQIRGEIGDKVNEIASVALTTHPLVLELTGKRDPKTGLEGKFSVFHSAACALLRGDGAPTAFTDESVNAPEIVALRDTITATTDVNCHEASVTIVVAFKDGTTMEKYIDRTIGSSEVPLTNQQIDTKFLVQSGLVIGDDASKALLDIAWKTASLADVGDVARRSSAHLTEGKSAAE